jgi:hypothetical protein
MTHAITLAAEKLSKAEGKRALVIVTDGMPDNRRPDEVTAFASEVDRLQQWAAEIFLILNKSIYFLVDSFPCHNNSDYTVHSQTEMTELQLSAQTKLQLRSDLPRRA